MITRFIAQNFQSLHKVDLKLERFTVIVGPSSSGKSAVVRALRTLSRNSAGAPFVTHGRKAAVLAAEVDGSTIVLERGPGKSVYTLLQDGQEEKFTKCGTTTPTQIAALLRLLNIEGTDINFAGQFDRPFLLDESATLVAKILGDLTNINIIFDAVREANRRRLATSSELKIRTTDLSAKRQQLQTYKTLPVRIAAVTKARELFDQVLAIAQQRKALDKLIVETGVLENFVATAQAAMVEVPDIEPVLQLWATACDLSTAIDKAERLERGLALAESDLAQGAQQLEEAEVEFHTVLIDSGECPLCGASTKKEMDVSV